MSAITSAYLQADSDRYSLWQNEQLQKPKRRNCKPIDCPSFKKKQISVFIAGSQENVDQEIGHAKNAIIAAITEFNNKNEIREYPFVCQTCDTNPYTDMLNPQLELYDAMINNADYFIFVLKDRIGDSTKHEIEEALKKREIPGVIIPSIIGFVYNDEHANSIEKEIISIFPHNSNPYLHRYDTSSGLKTQVKSILEDYHRGTLEGKTENIEKIRKKTIENIQKYYRRLPSYTKDPTLSFREVLKYLISYLFISNIRKNDSSK